jgi:small subunit ribosomal protein S18
MPRPKPTSRARPRGKGKYVPKRKVCSFCVNHVKTIDFKDVPLLRRYISDRGRIDPRRKTGVCAKHQRVLTVALKRARHIALLPYTAEHLRQSGTPVGREQPHREQPRREQFLREQPPKEQLQKEAPTKEPPPGNHSQTEPPKAT